MRFKVIMTVVAIILFLIGVGLRVGRHGWQQEVQQLREKLAELKETQPKTVGFDRLENLPEPVVRYFRNVLTEGAPFINAAEIKQEGKFRMSPDSKSWLKMVANQHFTASPPGFVWEAFITMAPLVKAYVCDAFIDGEARMRGKLLSLFNIIDEVNQPELNAAALQRYLGEAVWLPTALLPENGVSWEEIGPNRARASITAGGVAVSLEFTFNAAGEVVSVYAPERYREVDGDYVATPWSGHFYDYQDKDGYRIPLQAEVRWHLEEGDFGYWKATLTDVVYQK